MAIPLGSQYICRLDEALARAIRTDQEMPAERVNMLTSTTKQRIKTAIKRIVKEMDAKYKRIPENAFKYFRFFHLYDQNQHDKFTAWACSHTDIIGERVCIVHPNILEWIDENARGADEAEEMEKYADELMNVLNPHGWYTDNHTCIEDQLIIFTPPQ